MAPRSSLPSSHKKRKLDSEDTHNELLNNIRTLETDLTSAVSTKSSLNPLADLLDIAQKSSDTALLSKAIYALYRVFVLIITNGLLSGGCIEDVKAVRTWISERLHEYVELLCGLLKDEDSSLRTSALQILMSLEKHLSTSVCTPSNPQFHISHFKQIVRALLICPPSPRCHSSKRKKTDVDDEDEGRIDSDVRDLFMDKWLSESDDIRWFFLREAGTFLNSYDRKAHPLVPVNLLSLLEKLNTFPTDASELNTWWVEELGARPPKPKIEDTQDEDDQDVVDKPSNEDLEGGDDWRKFFEDEPAADVSSDKKKTPHARLHKLTIHQSLHSLQSHRAMFTRCWLALLPLLSTELTESGKALSTRVLNVMHRGVMPHLTQPILVMDWVAGCVDYGGAVGLLGLNALFVLIKEYNLDYPSFFTRLYAFLDRDVLHLKHRARFFRLTETFLSSTLLPAALLASFVKRLARLSLSAPPAAIVMLIPFTYNLLKRHPALMVMIHRADEVSEEEIDPFNASEANPNITRAIDSSLWELYTHKQHYHSAISTLARIFEEAFTKPNYALEDFLDHTYSTLYETEAKRRIKKEPAIAMDPSPNASWFKSHSVDETELSNLDKVDSLWAFA
ncbi:CBF/Mak21 family-domain-containing protein [Abortiporus biennis]|nr:CBF/Mak21 family-domain-containing protein [Abortiporus biennis]